MRDRGFTLIELLMSLALGMVVATTAFAAFRVASQTVGAANRLSVENGLLRAGFLACEDEVDWWRLDDDPEKPAAERPLMQTDGMAFSPFSRTFPAHLDSDREKSLGWDRDERRWAMGEKSGWWRGNMAERGESDLRFGQYTLFASTEDAVVIPADDLADKPAYGTVAPAHHWLYRQCRGLMNAVGFYGLMEYAPANWLFDWYEDPRWGNGTNRGGQWWMTCWPGTDFNNGDGGQHGPRGKYRLTYMTSFLCTDPRRPGAGIGDLQWDNRHYFQTGYGADANSMRGFDARTDVPYDPLPVEPSAWPSLRISVARFYKNTRSVSLCRVRTVSPLSGATIELSYADVGTSLRGARQQRRRPDLGAGWSTWDNGPAAPAPDDLDSSP
jgi:prepilin-type N-terminal cleavage/methylation domain-containing protein